MGSEGKEVREVVARVSRYQVVVCPSPEVELVHDLRSSRRSHPRAFSTPLRVQMGAACGQAEKQNHDGIPSSLPVDHVRRACASGRISSFLQTVLELELCNGEVRV